MRTMAQTLSRPPRHRTYPRAPAKPVDLTARRTDAAPSDDPRMPWRRAVPQQRSYPRGRA
jgi:hypothetical protein